MKSVSVKKRCIEFGGRRTSISLEDEFWRSLKNIAHERYQCISHLIAEIDGARQDGNLSSAIRMFVLRYYRDKLDGQELVLPPTTPHLVGTVDLLAD